MLTLKEEDIQNLILKHTGKLKKGDKTPIFDLKTIVESGLSVLYAKAHLDGSIVQECQEEFTIYKKHKCSKEKSLKKIYKNTSIEITQISALDKTENTLKVCWTGYNLAILTADFNLQGYFRKDFLFQKKIPDAGALLATVDKICVGLFDGSLVYFDPITQKESYKRHHTDIITSLSLINNQILSSSLDGSIYHNSKIIINDTGVLDCKYISTDKYLCSCVDNNLVLYDKGLIKTFIGHKDTIKSLSYNTIGISTSRDGTVGYLIDEKAFETEYLGISLHKRSGVNQFVGYGMNKIVLYDTTKKSEIWKVDLSTYNLDIKDSFIAYSHNKNVNIRDSRSRDTLTISLNSNITEVSFSESGDMLLVCTDQSPFALDLRYL